MRGLVRTFAVYGSRTSRQKRRTPEADRATGRSRFRRAAHRSQASSFLSDECPRIIGLVSDNILIEVLTADALVSSQIVTWL